MRKFFILSTAVLLLFSCATVKSPYKKHSIVVDFTKFSNEGFLITESNSVSFEYKSIGNIQSIAQSGYEVLRKDESKKEVPEDDLYSYQELKKLKFGEYIFASAEDALDELVATAIDMNANGIINLKIEYIPATYGKVGEIITHSSYLVSGMAIKF